MTNKKPDKETAKADPEDKPVPKPEFFKRRTIERIPNPFYFTKYFSKKHK